MIKVFQFCDTTHHVSQNPQHSGKKNKCEVCACVCCVVKFFIWVSIRILVV